MSEQDSTIITLRNDADYLEGAKQLLKLNEQRPGALTCRTAACAGLDCGRCPLTPMTIRGSSRAERLTYPTLGDVRGAVDRVEQRDGACTKVTESKPTTTSDVHQPSHYKLFQDVESIEVIARSMTVEQFHGFCFGNILKYRLRAGKKSELATMEKDLAKASFYETLFEKHKGKCHA